MRGTPDPQLAVFTSPSTRDLIPSDHPIRKIPADDNVVPAELDDVFDGMYRSWWPAQRAAGDVA